MALGRMSDKAQNLARPNRHRGAKYAPRLVGALGLTVVPAGPRAQLSRDQPRAVSTASCKGPGTRS